MAISGKGEGKAKAAAKEIAPCGPHAIPAYIADHTQFLRTFLTRQGLRSAGFCSRRIRWQPTGSG
jgi:hypothetical protein